MTVSAPAAVRHVVEEYKRYLRTTFRFLDPHLRQQFEEHLQGMDVLVRGPYVTLARDFERGTRLRNLVDEGVLDPGILRPAWPFGDEPLYLHQERAARAGAAGRPFLVTTGTGSGKTECFLIPAIDHCLKARARGEEGVKVVLLDPMNALANDQLERLRALLRGSGLSVTFGLYVQQDADKLDLPEPPVEGLERTNRTQIRNDPPDVLLTNYKMMLKYLLVRKEDRHLFTPSLRFLVLDEIHSYRGALATEIACLIRRLKAHAGLEPGKLAAVGTSATVAEGEEGIRALAAFATALFGEEFDPADVFAEHLAPASDVGVEAWAPLPPAIGREEVEGLDVADDEAVVALAERLTGRAAPASGPVAEQVGALLRGNAVFQAIEEAFRRPRTVAEAAEELKAALPERVAVPPEALKTEIEAYVVAGSVGDDEHPPRLRPKLHAFFHGVYDVYLCLNPECRTLVPHGETTCPTCGSVARPAVLCRTCGQDFVKVREQAEGEPPAPDTEFRSDSRVLFLTPKVHVFTERSEEDEAEEEEARAAIGEAAPDDGLQGTHVCLGCGRVGDTRCAACDRETTPYRMKRGPAHTCPACGNCRRGRCSGLREWGIPGVLAPWVPSLVHHVRGRRPPGWTSGGLGPTRRVPGGRLWVAERPLSAARWLRARLGHRPASRDASWRTYPLRPLAHKGWFRKRNTRGAVTRPIPIRPARPSRHDTDLPPSRGAAGGSGRRGPHRGPSRPTGRAADSRSRGSRIQERAVG
jgi:hypothetical protein